MGVHASLDTRVWVGWMSRLEMLSRLGRGVGKAWRFWPCTCGNDIHHSVHKIWCLNEHFNLALLTLYIRFGVSLGLVKYKEYIRYIPSVCIRWSIFTILLIFYCLYISIYNCFSWFCILCSIELVEICQIRSRLYSFWHSYENVLLCPFVDVHNRNTWNFKPQTTYWPI